MTKKEYRDFLLSALKALNGRIHCNTKDGNYDESADFSYKRAIIAEKLYLLDKEDESES